MGYLIAVEGNDGAGKSSQIKWLEKYYKSKGFKVLVVRYNMSYITLPAIKEGKKRGFSPEINTYLHFLSIKDQLNRFVKKKLKKDFIVIFDRYIYSVLARGYARNVNSSILNSLHSQIDTPDKIIFLDISPQYSVQRLGSNINFWEAGQDIYPNLSKVESFCNFQNIINEKMKNLIEKETNYIILDAKESKKIVFHKILEFLKGD